MRQSFFSIFSLDKFVHFHAAILVYKLLQIQIATTYPDQKLAVNDFSNDLLVSKHVAAWSYSVNDNW